MIDRRNFFRLAGLGGAGLALDRRLSAGTTGEAPSPRIRAFRPLGNTGLQLSDIGFGAINLFTPNVLRYAQECGVNHFDTAEGYLNTHSESYLGQALKGVRDKVVITTKHLQPTPSARDRAALGRRVETSLRRLQTDYLDIALVHAADDPVQIEHEEVLAAYTRLKQEGKARFIGFSTHNPKVMVERALASGPWEVILLIYNHMEGPAIEPLIARARQKGIGIIAMKVLAGGMQGSLKALVSDRVHYPQAAIRWVLGNPDVDALIVTMSTYSHVEEYLAASGMPLRRSDPALLARYRKAAAPVYCRVSCRQCLASCPRGVAINDVLRYAMYFEQYGMQFQALRLYAELSAGRTAAHCAGCPAPCSSACPHGLEIPARLASSHLLLSPGPGATPA